MIGSRSMLALVAVGALAAGPARADGPPWLGVRYAPAGGGAVRIVEVYPETPAAAAGLQPDDYVVGLNGQPVVDLSGQVAAIGVGGRLRFTLFRDGRPRTAAARLVERPAPDELVHRMLVGRDLPVLPAADGMGLPVRPEAWRGQAMAVVLFDARCAGCAAGVAELVDELRRHGLERTTRVQALILADSRDELAAALALAPVPAPVWRIEREVGAGLLGALEQDDGAVLVVGADGRIRYAAALSTRGRAQIGACANLAAAALAR
ncbi:MAG: PDZ domain-containing protein [Kofleriaceae bacterium]